MITEQDLSWARERRLLAQQAEDEARARWWAFREREERRLHAARAARQAAAQKAATPPPPATSGKGWRVTDPPGTSSHEALEKLAHDVFDLVFHALPFPKNWRVRWGEIRHYDPAAPFDVSLACVDTDAKIMIVDRRYKQDLVHTIAHELVHMLHPAGERHGQGFQRTLATISAYLQGLAEPEAPPVRPARPVIRPTTVPAGPRPDAAALVNTTKGQRYRPGMWGEGWEYRG